MSLQINIAVLVRYSLFSVPLQINIAVLVRYLLFSVPLQKVAVLVMRCYVNREPDHLVASVSLQIPFIVMCIVVFCTRGFLIMLIV